jgi:hypothetical protein
MIGAAPVPVPPPMPAAMKHHVRAFARFDDLRRLSWRRPCPTSGRAPAPRPSVMALMAELDAVGRAGARQRLRVGVRDHELDALQLASIMLLTALPPAPPTPNTTIRGLKIGGFG